MILNEADLVRWGNRIGQEVSGPLFIGLKGPLGAGKSVLARAVARGAGIEGPIPSPTFNLMFEYSTERGTSLVHMDLYRLLDPEELWELGWEELGSSSEIVLLEWPERAESFLPQNRWEVELVVPSEDSDLREVAVTRFGHPKGIPGFPVILHGDTEEGGA